MWVPFACNIDYLNNNCYTISDFLYFFDDIYDFFIVDVGLKL